MAENENGGWCGGHNRRVHTFLLQQKLRHCVRRIIKIIADQRAPGKALFAATIEFLSRF